MTYTYTMSNTNLNYLLNSSEISLERLNGEVVIISFNSGNYYSCVGSAADILSLVSKEVDKTLWKEIICSKYKIDDLPVVEVDLFIDECLKENIIISVNSKLGGMSNLPDDFTRSSWNTPILKIYKDYQDLLLVDPIHDSSLTGWPELKDDN
jgi:hypothetical protein